MALPVIGAAVAAGGAVLDTAESIRANQAESDAELRNAEFFREQERFTIESSKREEELFVDESDDLVGAQTSSFAKAGVELQGSPMLKLAETRGKIDDEIQAIRKERDFRVKLLRSRAQGAEAAAQTARRRTATDLFRGGIGIGKSVLGAL